MWNKERLEQFEHLFEAVKAGKEIEVYCLAFKKWATTTGNGPQFDSPVQAYRIKPEQPLPELFKFINNKTKTVGFGKVKDGMVAAGFKNSMLDFVMDVQGFQEEVKKGCYTILQELSWEP